VDPIPTKSRTLWAAYDTRPRSRGVVAPTMRRNLQDAMQATEKYFAGLACGLKNRSIKRKKEIWAEFGIYFVVCYVRPVGVVDIDECLLTVKTTPPDLNEDPEPLSF
jgi:hypothetical protein